MILLIATTRVVQ